MIGKMKTDRLKKMEELTDKLRLILSDILEIMNTMEGQEADDYIQELTAQAKRYKAQLLEIARQVKRDKETD